MESFVDKLRKYNVEAGSKYRNCVTGGSLEVCKYIKQACLKQAKYECI